MIQTEWVICANENCKHKFKRFVKGSRNNSRRTPVGIRPSSAVTCCSKCGKERVYNHYHKLTKMKNGIIYNCESS